MRIVFFGKGKRGTDCLKALQSADHDVALVVTHPSNNDSSSASVDELAKKYEIPTISPSDPNGAKTLEILEDVSTDIFILAGYGKILDKKLLSVPNVISLNLHAGKLPEYRGSSPMNWALINGELEFTISVIAVDRGIDTGDILKEKTFSIDMDYTIQDLHRIANSNFPGMLLEVLRDLVGGKLLRKKQKEENARYYPLRFPDDGLVVWDLQTAEEIHNQVRALTDPYPCAFTFHKGSKLELISSCLDKFHYGGEPGRVYRISSDKGLLVSASDRCLWITKYRILDGAGHSKNSVLRYDTFATAKERIFSHYMDRS